VGDAYLISAIAVLELVLKTTISPQNRNHLTSLVFCIETRRDNTRTEQHESSIPVSEPNTKQFIRRLFAFRERGRGIIRTKKVRHESINCSCLALETLCSFLAPTFPSHITQTTTQQLQPKNRPNPSGPSQLIEHQTWRSCQVRPELFSTHGHHPSVLNLKKMATEGDVEGKNRTAQDGKA
jgi:hypothetical protein